MKSKTTEHSNETAVRLPWHYTFDAPLTRLLQGHERPHSAEINAAACLDWNVYQAPAYMFVAEEVGDQPAHDSDGTVTNELPPGSFKLVGSQRMPRGLPQPDYYFNVRDDVHRVVGVVKKRYRVLQNGEAPRFLDELVRQGEARYEAAGCLHGGARVWWLLELRESIAVAGDPREELETYILLTNSHDGSTSIVTSALSIRVACRNTLAWPLAAAPRTVEVRHTDSAKEQAIRTHRALELAVRYQVELATLAERMLFTPMSDAQFREFLDALVPTPKPCQKGGRITNQRGITVADNTKGLITNVYYHNDSQKNIEGTLWGTVQACQFYADHMSISRNTPDAPADENRFKRLTSGNNLGAKAFSNAQALVR